MLSEFGRVRLQNAVLEITSAEVEHYVQQIDQVHEVVKDEPDEQRVHGDLGEAEPENDHPKVVQKGKRDHHGPVVAQPTCRIEHERPIASESRKNFETRTKSTRSITNFPQLCSKLFLWNALNSQ